MSESINLTDKMSILSKPKKSLKSPCENSKKIQRGKLIGFKFCILFIKRNIC
ncbi:hypothetical protein GCM10007096_31460 [Pullulanibacillus pueri]|uniref:Uncharacterized protein n=1 Tax=Pullulanibacillus pueri TaxID=1437324 RepID=A0A8J2ZY07_9BACL|nr:hypothetical protein GCM10007096_31460 [Pullulanibacillus pueri]